MELGGGEQDGVGVCVGFDNVDINYQLVFPIVMYESHYIGSLDLLELYELD